MRKYKHLFFDLDHTLWDLEKNSAETLSEIFTIHQLQKFGISSLEAFTNKYSKVNEFMWEQFRLGNIDKPTLRNGRFAITLQHFGVQDEMRLAKILADDYISRSPDKTHLLPETKETLDYLKDGYSLYIITNGFPEVQKRKLTASGLDTHFKNVFISEEIGIKKPEKGIFDFALKSTGAIAAEAIMIGDNYTIDIMGAKNSGIDQVWYNPKREVEVEKATYEIYSLGELKRIL